MARLAAAAGLSVQMLYLAWGSKRALLRGYMENALAGGNASPEDASHRFTGLSPRERLAELAALVTEVAGRAAIGRTLYRDAAAVDPRSPPTGTSYRSSGTASSPRSWPASRPAPWPTASPSKARPTPRGR